MSRENLCNDGSCKLLRMTGDRNHKHENKNKNKTKLLRVALAYLFGLTYGVTLALVIGIHFGTGTDTVIKDAYGNWLDVKNWVAMIVTLVIPIGVAVGLWYYSHKQQQIMHDESKIQQEKISSLTDEVHKIVKEDATTKEEIKQDLSWMLNRNLASTINGLERTLKSNEYYSKESNPDKKKNFWNSMLNNFDRGHKRLDLHLDLLKLIEIYGRATGRQYWNLLHDLQVTSGNFFFDIDDISELPAFIEHVKDCKNKCENLKKIIEPMASDTVKSRDSPPPDKES